LYPAPSPPGAQERDVSARWTRMTDWCARVEAPLKRDLEGGIPSQRPAIADLTDVFVFPGLQWAPILDQGRVVLDGYLNQRTRLRSESPASPLLMNRPPHAELRLPQSLPIVHEPALLVGGTDGYHHNTVALFSSLAIAETLEMGLSLPLVVNDDLSRSQQELLHLLGYADRRLIRVAADAPQHFRRLMVPSRLVRGGRWVDPLVPAWYRRKLTSPSAALASDKRLYIASDSPSCRVANEDALIAMLQQCGFEVVKTRGLSIRQQVDLFSRASHIVGPPDDAMTNMLFSTAGTKVIALYSQRVVSAGGDLYFDALAAACGHTFLALACAPHRAREGERLIDQEVVADLEAIRSAL
jgi:Glycosyltransferase 61